MTLSLVGVVSCVVLCMACIASMGAGAVSDEPARSAEGGAMYPAVSAYLDARAGEFGMIDEKRKRQLEEVSTYIEGERSAGRAVRLVFVCTHNSRRSHMSQLWAAAAAEKHGIEISTYSGGTETTAFNPRAVASLKRAGFDIQKTTNDENPVYHVRMGAGLSPLTCFSKVYDQAPNPKQDFGAVMVCDEADESCPFVIGSNGRFALPFVDPKISDDTDEEAATYDERCAQIAREMLSVMSRVG